MVLLLTACKPAPTGAAPAAGGGGSAAGASEGSGRAAASGGSAAGGAAPSAAASAPPVSITTVVARKRDLPLMVEGTGTVAPTLTVDVKPQLTSVIRQAHVKEGQFVRAGQPLFTLDAAADEANVARLRAQLARDEAALADAQRQYKRSQELVAQNFVSQNALDTAQTLVQTQTAAVAASRAAIDAARVPVGYARIVAPSSGRVGAINLHPGSSVQANVTTLVTITQLDPVDIAFTVPQRWLADVLAALRNEKSDAAQVKATLPEGGGPRIGRLVFVDNAVDAASGTVKVKARFPNKDSRLWPGAFVRTELTVSALKDAVVIPQAAIVQSARGTVVFVISDGKASIRPVQVVGSQGDDAAVSNVRPGERIALDGRQNLRPGSAVVERPREGRPAGASGAGRGGRGASAAAGGMPGGPAAGAALIEGANAVASGAARRPMP